MASVLERGPRTMSRELVRNVSRGDRLYCACTAQTLAAARACQPRRPRKLLNAWLWQYVRTHLPRAARPNRLPGAPPRWPPAPLRKTLTYDRGKEMAEHERLAQRLAIQAFFADPSSPWQRGTNENTNGLLRQYLPKGAALEVYTQLRHYSPGALGS